MKDLARCKHHSFITDKSKFPIEFTNKLLLNIASIVSIDFSENEIYNRQLTDILIYFKFYTKSRKKASGDTNIRHIPSKFMFPESCQIPRHVYCTHSEKTLLLHTLLS